MAKTCSVDGCYGRMYADGVCHKHWRSGKAESALTVRLAQAQEWAALKLLEKATGVAPVKAKPQGPLTLKQYARREKRREWVAKNRERLNEYQKSWTAANPLLAKQIAAKAAKKYWAAHKGERAQRTKKWRDANKDKVAIIKANANKRAPDWYVRNVHGLAKETPKEVIEIHKLVIQIRRESRK